MVVTNLRRYFSWRGQIVERNPVATLHREFIAVERRVVAHDDAVVGGVELDDVQRLGRGDAQTLALANRIEFNAVMLAEHLALGGYDLPPMLRN